VIPILEFDFTKYEIHQYEAAIAFGKTCVLRDILNEKKDDHHVNLDIVSYLFTELMTFRSRYSDNVKVLFRRGSINQPQHETAHN